MSATRAVTAAPPATAVTGKEFRDLMAGVPACVTVVTTTGNDEQPYGMTCSSLCSLTTQPPTMLLCLRSAGPTCRSVLASGALSINFLHAGARSTAELFASGNPARFTRITWTPPEGHAGGPHLLHAAHAVADCTVTRACETGDHTAVFAQITALRRYRAGLPLMYGMRFYGTWTDHLSQEEDVF